MARLGVKLRILRILWRVRNPLWRRRFSRQAGLAVLILSAAGGAYYALQMPVTKAAVQEVLQCRSNMYDCRDFRTQREAQALYRLCGGRQNDVHNLDSDVDGMACERLP